MHIKSIDISYPHLNGHSSAVEAKWIETFLSYQPLKSNSKFTLSESKGMTKMKLSIHIGIWKRHEVFLLPAKKNNNIFFINDYTYIKRIGDKLLEGGTVLSCIISLVLTNLARIKATRWL